MNTWIKHKANFSVSGFSIRKRLHPFIVVALSFLGILGFRIMVAQLRWKHVPNPFLGLMLGMIADLTISLILSALFLLMSCSSNKIWIRALRSFIKLALIAIVVFFLSCNIGSLFFWGAYLSPEDLSYLLDLPFLLQGILASATSAIWHTFGLLMSMAVSVFFLYLASKEGMSSQGNSTLPTVGILLIISFFSLMTSYQARIVRGEPLENNPIISLFQQWLEHDRPQRSEESMAYLLEHLKKIGAEVKPTSLSLSRNTRYFRVPSDIFLFEDQITQRTNIVMILLESFGAREMKTHPESVVNLQSLLEQGIHLKRHFTTMFRTGGAEFAVLCSLYNPAHFLATRKYPNASLRCLPKILKENNYHTIAISADPDPFDNEAEWLKSNGFDIVITVADFLDARPSWPRPVVDDEILYKRALLEFQKLEQPFFAYLVAQSNHFPYILPPNAEPKEGLSPLYNTMLYADKMLSEFISFLKKRYPDTLIVVFGDHGPWMSPTGKTWEKSEKSDILSRFHVPAFLIHPSLKPKTIEHITSHIDIAPTILSLIGGKFETDFVGQSVFDRPIMSYVLAQESQAMSSILLFDENMMLIQDLRSGICRSLLDNEERQCFSDESLKIRLLRQAFMDTTIFTIKASLVFGEKGMDVKP